jgi:hypothetical protein
MEPETFLEVMAYRENRPHTVGTMLNTKFTSINTKIK